MKTLEEAAGSNEIVTATIAIVEQQISKAGHPMLKVVMKCKDCDNLKLDGLLFNYLSSSQKAEIFVEKFIKSLQKPTSVRFESDLWYYNENELINNTTKCKLALREWNNKQYPFAMEWFQPVLNQEETAFKDDPVPSFNASEDIDVPF